MALFTGLVILSVTFVFACCMILLCWVGIAAGSDLFFDKTLHLPAFAVTLGGAAFIALLFLKNSQTNRDQVGTYKLQHTLRPIGGLNGALATMLANPEATSGIIFDILFSGPRLVIYSGAKLIQAFRLLKTDIETATATLAVLTGRLHRIPLEELSQALAPHDPMESLFRLQEIDCVLFLVREPPGVILTAEIRAELNTLLGRPIYFESEVREPPPPLEVEPLEGSEHYELLGLQPPVTLSEIKSAYRKRIKLCHPDKLAGRGEDFRKLAEERAKALNAAYEFLVSQQELKSGSDLQE